MKQLITTTIALFVSIFISYASFFQPYDNDALRFSLVNPSLFHASYFDPFVYSIHNFGPGYQDPQIAINTGNIDPLYFDNSRFWSERHHGIPSLKDVYLAIYTNFSPINDKQSNNQFIQCLYENNDSIGLEYLRFAKGCEFFNSANEDAWGRSLTRRANSQKQAIEIALKNAEKCPDEAIKLRYAFLAIRMAYYSEDFNTLKSCYKTYFEGTKNKTMTYYWALYFVALIESNESLKNFYLAQIFEHAPDKRSAAKAAYNGAINIQQILKHAKNNKEKAAVWALQCLHDPAQGLKYLENVYTNAPSLTSIEFLLYREINKLEDWILTPYMNGYSPVVSRYNLKNAKKEATLSMESRIQRDRAYAKEVLTFVQKVNLSKVKNPLAWQFARAYLFYLSGDAHSGLLAISSLVPKLQKGTAIYEQAAMIKTLCQVSLDAAQMKSFDKETLIILKKQAEQGNYKFVFAIARSLEFSKNTSLAALLFSKLNPGNSGYDGEPAFSTFSAFWSSKSNKTSTEWNFYYKYFFYLDAEYTAAQMEHLIKNIKQNQAKDSLSIWLYSSVKADIGKLYDLMGTKYLRRNRLNEALLSFEKVDNAVWNSGKYKSMLDANPFYTTFNNEHSKTKADTITYNKASLVKQLLAYMKKAEDPNNKNRDYYCFLVATCYFNMTQYGNSWYMRRYYWSNGHSRYNLEDDDEFFGCNLAKEYFLKARWYSKNKKFGILCTAMAGRCEQYKLEYARYKKVGNYWDLDKVKLGRNEQFAALAKQHPAEFDEIKSNCLAFENFLAARLQNK